MSKLPGWLKAEVAGNGARVVTGERTQAEAAEAVRQAILSRPEFVADLAAALAAGQVGNWVRIHRSSGDLFQAALFPGIPPVMHISVGRSMATADMTANDLDHARNMLLARTRNARAAAVKAHKDFTAFYAQVRPLLRGDRTVAGALAELAASQAA